MGPGPPCGGPRQAAALLVAALPEDAAAARAAAVSLGSAVESHRYAPQPTRPSAEDLVRWVGEITDALSAARRADAPNAPRGG